jgi:hypothetical protein
LRPTKEDNQLLPLDYDLRSDNHYDEEH